MGWSLLLVWLVGWLLSWPWLASYILHLDGYAHLDAVDKVMASAFGMVAAIFWPLALPVIWVARRL